MPDPIAPRLPLPVMAIAPSDSDDPAPLHACADSEPQAGADPDFDIDTDIDTVAGWHCLPDELRLHVASFLPWQAIDALGQTHRRTRDALAPATVATRVAWRIASVSSLSTLARTLAELGSPVLSDGQRAHGLAALADRLPSLHGGMVSAARDLLLGASAQLPVALRVGALARLMQGLARCREPIDHERGARPLLAAVDALPPAQRATVLIACLGIGSLPLHAMPSVERWIDGALRLPIPGRGALLAQVLRRFSFVSASRDDARVQRFLQVCGELRMPDGTPSWSEQADLLTALAIELDQRRTHGLVENQAAAHDLWTELVNAADRLPDELALDVMVGLAGPGALRPGEGAGPRWSVLWQAGQRFGANPARYARWLAALAANHGWQEPADAWQRLNEAARTLPAEGQATVLAMLTRGIHAGADLAERQDRWRALYEQTVGQLPVALRTGPLTQLADALHTEEAGVDDGRWADLVAALPPLTTTSRIKVLLGCIDIGTAERFWEPCRGGIMQLPGAERAAALADLAERLVHLRPSAARAAAWSDIAESVLALPPAQRSAPWQMLLRRIYPTFPSDLEAQLNAYRTLAALLIGQPPLARQQCLLAAGWNTAPERCLWVLTQVGHLPAALRAEVLVRVAHCAHVGVAPGWNAARRVQVWIDLLQAVRELPTHYRGAPLHQMAQLLANLPPAKRHRARRHFAALLRGVSPSDIPPGFASVDPFSESAMVRRALKRPRHPEDQPIVSPKRRRLNENWP